MRASQTVVPLFLAQLNPEDPAVLQGLLESGKVKPMIDRTYSLPETPKRSGISRQGTLEARLSSPSE